MRDLFGQRRPTAAPTHSLDVDSGAGSGADARPKEVRLGRRAWLGRFALPSVAAAGFAACAPATERTLRSAAVADAVLPTTPVSPVSVEPVVELVTEPLPPPAPPPPPRIPVFYRPEYTLSGFNYETTRKARWVADSLVANPLEALEVIAPESLTESDLDSVHDSGYVAAVRTGEPRRLAQSQGWPWDRNIFPMALASNGGAVAAAHVALETGVAGSLSSGLHHARRGWGNGNCTFNGLALAARQLQAAGVKRILILDLDAHCGGGTDEILGTDPGVHLTDVAVFAFDVYTPRGANTLDLVRNASSYLPTIRRRLDALDGSAFDICLYNAGMDPHEGCGLGGLRGISTALLAEREQLVFEWCRAHNLPVAFVLAGGYLGPGLDQAGLTELHRLTLSAAAQMPVRATSSAL